MQKTETIQKPGENRPAVSVQRVSLEHFRNFRWLELGLSERFNVLTGANGQGKTNFLEALYLLATTRLLRGQRDHEAIFDGADRCVAAAELAPSGTRLSVSIERGARKRALLNGLALPRASDLIGRLPCVSVSSVDMEIVRGEPSERRLFLDLELSALYPAYLRRLATYKRSLEHRNALLKEARERSVPPSVFEPWEEQLADSGMALRDARREYVERLSPRMSGAHARLGEGEAVSIAYQARDECHSADELRSMLAHQRPQEVARGSTLFGPHRDDLEILVVGREARLFGSQGQQRTAVIALKLASLEVAREELGQAPLLLLDDIFSDLDERRRSLLVDVVLDNAGQVVLTCTEASAAGPRILESARLFHVVAGEVVEL